MSTRRAACSCGQLHLTIEGEPSRGRAKAFLDMSPLLSAASRASQYLRQIGEQSRKRWKMEDRAKYSETDIAPDCVRQYKGVKRKHQLMLLGQLV